MVGFFTEIGEGIQAIFAVVTEALSAFFKEAWEAIKAVWDTVAAFFAGVWEGISGAFSDVAEFFGGIFTKAWEAVTFAWDGVTEFFQGIWDGIVNVFSGIWDTFSEIGSNIVDGIWDGISGAWDSFLGWLSGKVNGIVDFVKDLLGIHSPSTVFAGIGENMAIGLSEGWADEYIHVKKQIEGGMNFDTATISFAGTGAAQSDISRAVQQSSGSGDTYNFYSPKALDPVSAAREMKKARRQLAMGFCGG